MRTSCRLDSAVAGAFTVMNGRRPSYQFEPTTVTNPDTAPGTIWLKPAFRRGIGLSTLSINGARPG